MSRAYQTIRMDWEGIALLVLQPLNILGASTGVTHCA